MGKQHERNKYLRINLACKILSGCIAFLVIFVSTTQQHITINLTTIILRQNAHYGIMHINQNKLKTL